MVAHDRRRLYEGWGINILDRNIRLANIAAMCKTIIDWRNERKMKQAEAAALVGVTQGTWAKWEAGQVPPEQCLSVHQATRIPLHRLRPDIYPAPPMRRESDRKKAGCP